MKKIKNKKKFINSLTIGELYTFNYANNTTYPIHFWWLYSLYSGSIPSPGNENFIFLGCVKCEFCSTFYSTNKTIYCPQFYSIQNNIQTNFCKSILFSKRNLLFFIKENKLFILKEREPNLIIKTFNLFYQILRVLNSILDRNVIQALLSIFDKVFNIFEKINELYIMWFFVIVMLFFVVMNF